MKLCLVSDGALGDFIETIPVLVALRQKYATDTVELVTARRYLPLIEPLKVADITKPTEELSDGYFNSFDQVISFRGEKFIPIPNTVRPTGVNINTPRSQFLMQGLGLVGDVIPKLPHLTVNKIESQVAVHCAFDRGPRWGSRRWLECCQNILASGRALLLVGSGQEAIPLRDLVNKLPKERVTVLFNRPLDEVGRALVSCSCFVAHDSGIAHLAGAVGLSGEVVHFQSEAHGKIWKPPQVGVRLIKP